MTLIGTRVDNNFKYSELTDTVIGVFYEVYNELGFGFFGICVSRCSSSCTFGEGLDH